MSKAEERLKHPPWLLGLVARVHIGLLVTIASLAVVGVPILAIGYSYAQQQGGYVPAPDRPGGDGDAWCPPNGRVENNKLVKDAPDHEKDKDVDNADGDNDPQTGKDYYMGEYKFVEGDKDLIIRIWCLSWQLGGVPGSAHFNDYFSYEIITSRSGEETPRVKPGVPI